MKKHTDVGCHDRARGEHDLLVCIQRINTAYLFERERMMLHTREEEEKKNTHWTRSVRAAPLGRPLSLIAYPCEVPW